MHRHALITALTRYETRFTAEKEFVAPFLLLLQHPRAFFRDHLPGHITGSAWITDESKQYVLLTHHAKLNRWLQPGGHADGNENVLDVALREAEEETGLKDLKLLQGGIFDIDIHTIPARNDFPAHLHYDVRFLIEARRTDNLLISEESHDLAWIHTPELSTRTHHNVSMLRMAEKVATLF